MSIVTLHNVDQICQQPSVTDPWPLTEEAEVPHTFLFFFFLSSNLTRMNGSSILLTNKILEICFLFEYIFKIYFRMSEFSMKLLFDIVMTTGTIIRNFR